MWSMREYGISGEGKSHLWFFAGRTQTLPVQLQDFSLQS